MGCTSEYKINFPPKSFFFLVCFKVFDVDRDGVLSRVELRDMVVALLEVWKDNRTDDIPVKFCLFVCLFVF